MLKWHVKELIEARGMSMSHHARQAHVSYHTVKQICQNPYYHGKITTATWDRLATALEVGLFEVLREDSNENEPQG